MDSYSENSSLPYILKKYCLKCQNELGFIGFMLSKWIGRCWKEILVGDMVVGDSGNFSQLVPLCTYIACVSGCVTC